MQNNSNIELAPSSQRPRGKHSDQKVNSASLPEGVLEERKFPEHTKILLVSTSEKGGPGKTTGTALTLDLIRHAGIPTVVYDLDARNDSGIRRYVPDAVQVGLRREELEGIFRAVADPKHPAEIHFVDLPGSATELVEPLLIAFSPHLAAKNVRTHVILHLSRDEATLKSAVGWMKTLYTCADFTLMAHLKDGEFDLRHSLLGQAAIEIAQRRLVTIPKISLAAMDFVRNSGLLLSEAAEAADFITAVELGDKGGQIWGAWQPHFQAVFGRPAPEPPVALSPGEMQTSVVPGPALKALLEAEREEAERQAEIRKASKAGGGR